LGDLKKGAEKSGKKTEDLDTKLKAASAQLSSVRSQGHRIAKDLESLRLLCGHLAAQKSRSLPPTAPLAEAEFQVASQWGEDGIIQFLLAHVPVPNRVFVEFGVESYAEANTRFLLQHDHWSGLIIDGSEDHMRSVRESDLGWRHTLTAKSAWISAENIDALISEAGITGDIGILSVDIDGVDYWVWQAIRCISPRIVIAEYNSLFGPEAKVTPVYDPKFERAKAHHSHVFYGASLAALTHQATERGYRLVGCNTAGNNVFFVRDDIAGPLPRRSVAEVYQRAKFREARSATGELLFPTFGAAQRIIQDCLVHDLSTGRDVPLHQATGWAPVAA
jgi:hypothetical protein